MVEIESLGVQQNHMYFVTVCDMIVRQPVDIHCLATIPLAIFQVNMGQPVFIEAKDDGSGGDNWSSKSCKAPVKS